MSESAARKKWIKENTLRMTLKLNRRTDKDIIEALDGKSMQTEIKKLVRRGLEQENN